jgi:hypothetical protein
VIPFRNRHHFERVYNREESAVSEGEIFNGDKPEFAFSTMGGEGQPRIDNERGFLEGGADPRGDGAALGY